jgi:glyoxylate reductase
MIRPRPRVIVTRKLPDSTETRMMELFDTRLADSDEPMSRDALVTALAEAEVLVPTVGDRIDADLIAGAGDKLKLIASFGTGIDHIDLKAARTRGIAVTNTPGVLTDDTADVAMALILDVARRITEGERLVRTGGWRGWSPTALLGRRIRGKRLGIVGMGRIGTALAWRARAFGLAIHYHSRRRLDPHAEAELEATWWGGLDAMLSRMDILSVNCPHTPQTHHLLSEKRLRSLPRHAILINTARGEVIDEAALASLVGEGRIAGVGLDVYEAQPRIHPGLRDRDNVVLLPHIGSATVEGRQEMGDMVIVNIRAFCDGHRPPNRVIEGIA